MPSYLTLVIIGRFGMFLRWTLTIDKCTLEAYQEFCHDLSFSENERNHNDTPDDGWLTRALWSVTCYAGRGSPRRLWVTGKRTPDRRNNGTDNNVYRARCPERSSLWQNWKWNKCSWLTGLDARSWFIRGRESIWLLCLQQMQRWKRIFTGYADSLQEKKLHISIQSCMKWSGKCFHRMIPIHRKHVQCLCRTMNQMMKNMQWQRSCGKDNSDYE